MLQVDLSFGLADDRGCATGLLQPNHLQLPLVEDAGELPPSGFALLAGAEGENIGGCKTDVLLPGLRRPLLCAWSAGTG